MGLIRSPRHSRADLEAWARFERHVRLYLITKSDRLARLTAKARADVEAFAALGPCWIGTSWGKDSTVVAHLADGLAPLCWVVSEPGENPDCEQVAEAFGGNVHRYKDLAWVRNGSLVFTPPEAKDHTTRAGKDWPPVEDFGPRYVYGLRIDESRARRLRFAQHGISSKNTCAPISTWTYMDVFAYLVRHDLPIHPAYAMSMGGALSPEWLRVAPLGGDRGVGHGRRSWEWHYYPDEMRELGISNQGR